MNTTSTKTIIIGAGISGITAALNFLDNNYSDFLLIEGSDRIGGRCHSIDFENSVFELGAQYIHGQVDNPIFYLARENNLIAQEYFEITDNTARLGSDIHLSLGEETRQYFLTENGDELPEELNNKINNIFDKCREEIDDSITSTCSIDASQGEVLFKMYIDKIKHQFGTDKYTDDENFRQIVHGLFSWRCRVENLINGCENLHDLSLKNANNYKDLHGDQQILLKNGYRNLIETLISRHASKFYDKLKLKILVRNILMCEKLSETQSTLCEHCQYVNDPNKIVVKTTDANNQDTIFICDQVICTISLGYLKENIRSLIRPNRMIPSEKMSAISRLGYGVINKIFLVYDKPFWNDDMEVFNLIWLHKSENELMDEINHRYDLTKYWYKDMQLIERHHEQENVLGCWVGGNHVHENLSDEQIVNDCTELFRKFFKNQNIPKPVRLLRTRWSSDPFARGSYSFCQVGCHTNDNETLAEPIVLNNKIFIQFAGEATHKDFFSTVHGAYLTGLRESNRILNIEK